MPESRIANDREKQKVPHRSYDVPEKKTDRGVEM